MISKKFSSTTLVFTKNGPRVAGGGGLRPGPGGGAPTPPGPPGARRGGGPATPRPRAGDAPPGRSAGSSRRGGCPRGSAGQASCVGPALAAEGRQTAPASARPAHRLLASPLLPPTGRGGGQALADHGEQGLREQRQRHMAIPARPAAHLVVVQPDLAFGLLEGHLDRPAPPRHPHQVLQRGPLPREDHVRLLITPVAQPAPYHTPTCESLLQGRHQGHALPVVPAGSFGPVARGEPLPALLGQLLEQCAHPPTASMWRRD